MTAQMLLTYAFSEDDPKINPLSANLTKWPNTLK